MTLHLLTETDFDAVYALLVESFPPEEYRDYDKQKAIFQKANYKAFGLKSDLQLTALITLWQFDTFAYIEHFAVTDSARNQGLGTAILEEIKAMFSCPLCLEVELPETELANRRIGFYERNSFFYNDYPYIQPAYSVDKSPVPLRIMTTGGHISPERFTEMKRCIYRDVYNKTV